MKRDLDLIRNILIKMEESPGPFFGGELKFQDKSHDEVHFHLKLMRDAGLIHAEDLSGMDSIEFFPLHITWEGYEFLEAAKDDARWNEVKSKMSTIGGFVYEIAKPLLIELARREVFPE
jgi:hypothetical protein